MSTVAAQPSSASSGKPVKKLALIPLLVGLAFMFLFGKIVPPWGPVTEMGVSIIGVFIGTLVIIGGTNDLIAAPLFGFVGIILTGYVDANGAIVGLIGNSTVFQMITVMAMCTALMQSGAGEVIARFLLTRKFLKGRPLLFTFALLYAFFLADIIMNNTGAILLSFAIFSSVCKQLGYKPEDAFSKIMHLGLYLVAMLSPTIIPFRGLALTIVNSFNAATASYGYQVNYGTFMIASFLVSTAFFILYALAIKFVFRIDLERVRSLDMSKLEGMENTSFTKNQVFLLVSFIIGVLYTFVMMVLPETMPGYAAINSLSQVGWFVLVIAVLCIVRIDGKPVFDAPKSFAATMWGVVLCVGIFSIIGGGLSNPEIGIRTWLLQMFGPIFDGLGFVVFMILVCAIAGIVTNFFSNMATGVIVCSIAAPFVMNYHEVIGINPTVVSCAIVNASMFAYMTYAAAGTAPLLLGREGIDGKFIWTKGAIVLLMYIVSSALLYSALAYIL